MCGQDGPGGSVRTRGAEGEWPSVGWEGMGVSSMWSRGRGEQPSEGHKGVCIASMQLKGGQGRGVAKWWCEGVVKVGAGESGQMVVA